MDAPLRLSSVMAVARILLCTLPSDEALGVLLDQYGWDATFQALGLMHGGAASRAFALAWQDLLTAPIADALASSSEATPGDP